MEPQDKPMETDGDEQSSAEPLESASSASTSLQTNEEVEIHPVSPHVEQETGKNNEDEETDMEDDDDEADTEDDVEDSDTDDDESADESDDEQEPRDSDNQPQSMPQALEPMQLESFLETWPRRKVPRSTLKRAAEEVTEQWDEIKRACLPQEPVGSLADEEERRVLGRLIVERTHVRMVRSDDGDDVPRIYLPGSSVPVTPVESLLKPLRRLLKAASDAQVRDDQAGPEGDGGEEQSPEDTLQAIESLLGVILRRLPILQRKICLVRDRIAERGVPIVPKPPNAG